MRILGQGLAKRLRLERALRQSGFSEKELRTLGKRKDPATGRPAWCIKVRKVNEFCMARTIKDSIEQLRRRYPKRVTVPPLRR